MEHQLVTHLLILLIGATALVALCHRLGLSTIVGYLAAGLLFGPHLFGVLHSNETLRWMAEAGVILLMFTIGLEFSLPKLLAARKLVLGLGGAQVLLLTLLMALLLRWGLDIDGLLAIIIGGAFAMSSTAIGLKQLGEQGELNSRHGRIAAGILLFQDIAAIPFLVLLPLLGEAQGGLPSLLWPLIIKAVGVFLVLAFTGRYLLPRVLHWVAATHSLELFMLSVLAMALSAASLSMLAGLSATLGAFMAGMMLGETHFRHQIEADIRPFRDLMLGIFFMSVGMQLDPSILLQHPALITGMVAALIAGKAILQWLLIRAFGYPSASALRAALALAQGGEFGLLLVSQALSYPLGEQRLLQPLLAALIISMLAAPLVLRHNARIAQRLHGRETREEPLPDNSDQDTSEFDEHVLIFGYGRLGQGIARVLQENTIDTLAIDRDPERVRSLRAQGETLLFGDASNPALLEQAQVQRARAAAITFDDFNHSLAVIAQIRRFNRDLPIMLLQPQDHPEPVRINDPQVVIFDAALESSLMFARQLLLLAGLDSDHADRAANAVRTHDYSELRVTLEEPESHSKSR